MANAKRPYRRKNPDQGNMTLDAIISRKEFEARRDARERLQAEAFAAQQDEKRRSGNIEFPRSHEGDILAHCWMGTVHNPCKWLANVANEMGFTPRKNPWTMSPAEQQKAIANVVCPQKIWDKYGVAVNFEQDPQTLFTSCVVVLCSTNLLNFWTVKYQHFHGAHFVAAKGSVASLNQHLANGSRGRVVITPVLYQGLPLIDNLSLIKPVDED